MHRTLIVTCLLCCSLGLISADRPKPEADQLKDKPITTAGGEVICIWPLRLSWIPAPVSTTPPAPKLGQSRPVAASSAKSRRSTAFMKIRSAHGAPAGAAAARRERNFYIALGCAVLLHGSLLVSDDHAGAIYRISYGGK